MNRRRVRKAWSLEAPMRDEDELLIEVIIYGMALVAGALVGVVVIMCVVAMLVG